MLSFFKNFLVSRFCGYAIFILLKIDFEKLNYIKLDHLTCAGQGVLAVQYKPGNKFAKEFQDSLNMIYKSINSGGCIFTCGNGGSFSDAQHFTAELIVRYKKDRYPLSSLTLGCNVSNLTACSNDYKYDEVFKREYSALSKKEDTLIAISTSGNSKNIINILKKLNLIFQRLVKETCILCTMKNLKV